MSAVTANGPAQEPRGKQRLPGMTPAIYPQPVCGVNFSSDAGVKAQLHFRVSPPALTPNPHPHCRAARRRPR